jgi:shikimate kinase
MIGLPKRHPRNLFLATKFEIILIGPVGSGKSTIAALLSKRLGLPRRSMDEVRWKYYDEISYDWGTAKESHIQGGFWGLYHYWKPFEAYAVKRLLENFRDCIFDFGGGNSVYEDDGLFEQVRELLAPYANVILLLPSPDLDKSVQILNTDDNITSDEQREVNEHFIRHHSNYDLAKFIVYTEGKTPEETCEEILNWLRRSK